MVFHRLGEGRIGHPRDPIPYRQGRKERKHGEGAHAAGHAPHIVSREMHGGEGRDDRVLGRCPRGGRGGLVFTR